MKKLTVVLCALILLFGVVGKVNASLSIIGTASYDSDGVDGPETYNLIYEDDSIDGGLVWIDYTNFYNEWQNQMDWATGLGGSLTVILDPGYITNIDWASGWRLPLTQDPALYEGDQTGSEMGHLYYVSLGKPHLTHEPGPDGFPMQHSDMLPFNNINYHWINEYWSGSLLDSGTNAYTFEFGHGDASYAQMGMEFLALAVHPGTVSAVPIPSAIWLLGSGVISLIGYRRNLRSIKTASFKHITINAKA